MVAVVGRLFQKWFPAQPNLSYTFIWDKTDAYGQRVYGLSEAVGGFLLTLQKKKYSDPGFFLLLAKPNHFHCWNQKLPS